jgi:hypothetical protein
MHDEPNVFGFRHEVRAGRATAGGFVFVGVVVASVYAFVTRGRRRGAAEPVTISAAEQSKILVDGVVDAARIDYIERTGASPVPVRTWKREI